MRWRFNVCIGAWDTFLGHVYATHTKVHHTYPDLSDKQTGWLEAYTEFHNSSETNLHQTLEYLKQHWCYGNLSVIGNEENDGAYGIGVTFTRLQQAMKIPV